jgi:hypothetical protein
LPAIAANASRVEQDRKVPDEDIAVLKGIGMRLDFRPKATAAWKSPTLSSPTV